MPTRKIGFKQKHFFFLNLHHIKPIDPSLHSQSNKKDELILTVDS